MPEPSSPDPRFDQAVAFVLAHEGGFVDHAADPGGATNFGVSLRFALADLAKDADGDGWLDGDLDHDGDIDADDIRRMSAADAAEIYRRHWWDRYGYGRIADLAVAAKVFDLAVNMGSKQAHKCLQRAIAACWCPLQVDGVLGVQTIQFANQAQPDALLSALKDAAAGFYRDLIAAKPQLAVFERGWLNRAHA